MKKCLCILFLVAHLCSANAQSTNTETLSQKSYLFFSMGAPAMFCGISFENLLYEKNKIHILPRVGIGFNILKPSLGHEFDLHTGLTMLYGKKSRNLEMGFGLIHYILQQYDFVSETNKHQYKPILYGIIGYRYNFHKNPLSLKLGISPVLVLIKDNKVFFPLLDLGIGVKI
ncbi:MAG: hypothetical protein WCK18_17690 [Prolixibacteraceae bacterium]|jgi:hypothetical protein